MQGNEPNITQLLRTTPYHTRYHMRTITVGLLSWCEGTGFKLRKIIKNRQHYYFHELIQGLCGQGSHPKTPKIFPNTPLLTELPQSPPIDGSQAPDPPRQTAHKIQVSDTGPGRVGSWHWSPSPLPRVLVAVDLGASTAHRPPENQGALSHIMVIVSSTLYTVFSVTCYSGFTQCYISFCY